MALIPITLTRSEGPGSLWCTDSQRQPSEQAAFNPDSVWKIFTKQGNTGNKRQAIHLEGG